MAMGASEKYVIMSHWQDGECGAYQEKVSVVHYQYQEEGCPNRADGHRRMGIWDVSTQGGNEMGKFRQCWGGWASNTDTNVMGNGGVSAQQWARKCRQGYREEVNTRRLSRWGCVYLLFGGCWGVSYEGDR